MSEDKVITTKIPSLITDNSIIFNPKDLDSATAWEDFISLWTISQEIDVRNQWFKGDIANRVSVVHGDGSLIKFANEVHENSATVEHYRRVSRAFPKDSRTMNLSWTHYFLASFTDSFNKGESKFESDNRFKWVEKAEIENWSTTRMTEEIKKSNALVSGNQDIFDYYNQYLEKVKHVLLHVEKSKLSKDQIDKLLDKLMIVYNDFTIYLDDQR